MAHLNLNLESDLPSDLWVYPKEKLSLSMQEGVSQRPPHHLCPAL